MDKNKFKEILTTIDSNKFDHKNKIGDFKCIDIKDLGINIKDNTIIEIDAKKRLNTLIIIKNSEIKHKRLIFGQKELLNSCNDLSDIILTDKALESSKDENEKLTEGNEKLKEENKNENENEDEDENDETMRQNEIKVLNDYLDEIIDKSKSFEDQIESLKKVENLEEYYFIDNSGDKELKFKSFKLILAHLSN